MESGSQVSPQKVDFRFRLRTDTSTVEGILLDYIRSGYHPSFPAKEMLVRAVRAFWLPFAYSDRQDLQVAPAFVKRLAQEAISSLRQQIRDIERIFDLESDVTFPCKVTSSIPFLPYPVQAAAERVPELISANVSNFDVDDMEIKGDPFS